MEHMPVNLTQKDKLEQINNVLDALTTTLSQPDTTLTIRNLGRFQRALRPARQGRNPQTGEAITIPAKQVLSFKASKSNGTTA